MCLLETRFEVMVASAAHELRAIRSEVRRQEERYGWSSGSFDHLVGASKQRGRDRESQRLGGLEVDKHLVSVRLLHGEVSGFCSAKDFVDVSSDLPAHCNDIRPEANQTTS